MTKYYASNGTESFSGLDYMAVGTIIISGVKAVLARGGDGCETPDFCPSPLDCIDCKNIQLDIS